MLVPSIKAYGVWRKLFNDVGTAWVRYARNNGKIYRLPKAIQLRPLPLLLLNSLVQEPSVDYTIDIKKRKLIFNLDFALDDECKIVIYEGVK